MTTLLEALETKMETDTHRTLIIDFDAAIDGMGNRPAPDYYYGSDTQQTQFNCAKCDEFNDIYGIYGYCAACGWRNNALHLKNFSNNLRGKLNDHSTSPRDAVGSIVSTFDATCRDFVRQIRKRIPMKLARQVELERLKFHDLDQSGIEKIKSMFDINMLRGLDSRKSFIKMMLHRRHIYEHNAGVTDRRYVQESGDSDAREGILIRETQGNANQLIGDLTRIAENFEEDFHEIFAPTQWPIDRYRLTRSRKPPS